MFMQKVIDKSSLFGAPGGSGFGDLLAVAKSGDQARSSLALARRDPVDGCTLVTVFSSSTGNRRSHYDSLFGDSSSAQQAVKVALSASIGVAVQGHQINFFGTASTSCLPAPLPTKINGSVTHVELLMKGTVLVLVYGQDIRFYDAPKLQAIADGSATLGEPLAAVSATSNSSIDAVACVKKYTFIASGDQGNVDVLSGLEIVASAQLIQQQQQQRSSSSSSGGEDESNNRIVALDAVEVGDAFLVAGVTSGGQFGILRYSNRMLTQVSINCTSQEAPTPRLALLQDSTGISSGSIALSPSGLIVAGTNSATKQGGQETWRLTFNQNCTSVTSASPHGEPVALGFNVPLPVTLRPAGAVVDLVLDTTDSIVISRLTFPSPATADSDEPEVSLSLKIKFAETPEDLAKFKSEAESFVSNLKTTIADLLGRLGGSDGSSKKALGPSDRLKLFKEATAALNSATQLQNSIHSLNDQQDALTQQLNSEKVGGWVLYSNQLKKDIDTVNRQLRAVQLLVQGGFDAATWSTQVQEAEKRHKTNASNFKALFMKEFGHLIQNFPILEASCFPSSSSRSCFTTLLSAAGFLDASENNVPSIDRLVGRLEGTDADAVTVWPLIAVLLIAAAPSASHSAQVDLLSACGLPSDMVSWSRLVTAAEEGKATRQQTLGDRPRALPLLSHSIATHLLEQALECLINAGAFDEVDHLGSQLLDWCPTEICARTSLRLAFLAYHKKQQATLEQLVSRNSLVDDGYLKQVLLGMMLEYGIATNQIDFVERVAFEDATADMVVYLFQSRPTNAPLVIPRAKSQPKDASSSSSSSSTIIAKKLYIQFLVLKRRHEAALTACDELQSQYSTSEAQQSLAVAAFLRSILKDTTGKSDADLNALPTSEESPIVEATAGSSSAISDLKANDGITNNNNNLNQSHIKSMMQQQQHNASFQQQIGGGRVGGGRFNQPTTQSSTTTTAGGAGTHTAGPQSSTVLGTGSGGAAYGGN